MIHTDSIQPCGYVRVVRFDIILGAGILLDLFLHQAPLQGLRNLILKNLQLWQASSLALVNIAEI